MTIKSILIGIVMGLVLPAAAANARSVTHSDLSTTGLNVGFERGVTPTAANFGRDEDDKKSDQGGSDRNDHDHYGDKDRNDHDHNGDKDRNDHDHYGDDDHSDHDHDGDHRCESGRGYDHRCDKSPSRP